MAEAGASCQSGWAGAVYARFVRPDVPSGNLGRLDTSCVRRTPVSDVCRGLGISEATFYVWKKKYASLGVTELRKLRQLEAENSRLKRLVADLTLDKHILQEVVAKKH